MIKEGSLSPGPEQYEIHEEGGERFVLANGEKIVVHTKPRTTTLSVAPLCVVAAAFVAGVAYLLAR
jgi:hypothetical protein